MDRSADPHKDFYAYATGRWALTHPIPPDKSIWGTFDELREWNMVLLRRIAEERRADKAAPSGSYGRMVGDFYASAIDTDRIENLNFAPIEGLWQRIGQVSSVDNLLSLVVELHSSGIFPLFDSASVPDDRNGKIYSFYMAQGGLSLPDRDYYLRDLFSEIRNAYLEHMRRMFALKGIPEDEAARWSKTILEIETEIAKVSRTKTELRDPVKNYNQVTMPNLDKEYSGMGFLRYLKGLGVPQMEYVVVCQPEFFDWLNKEIGARGIEEWKIYLRWNVLHAYAPLLHKAVETENFEFFRRKLMGQKEPEPRWKRAIGAIDRCIGEALGKLYVERHFTEQTRGRALEMINDILLVFKKRLQGLPWMSEPTRQKALAKLAKFEVKIGYPEKFRDYSGLVIDPNDYAGNVRRANEFEVRRQLSRTGGPVDRNEWYMTPPEVNAYYMPTSNAIFFPAGILQPPFFDAEADDAVNYGAIGAVIGHEITHGFDDAGKKYDGDGNLNEWWTPDDEKEFKARTGLIVKAYSSKEPLPGLFINGELTLGENIADIGGLSIAYEALQSRLTQDPSRRRIVDNLTPEQRLFIAWAQEWHLLVRDEELKRRLSVDPHAPGNYRATVAATCQPTFDIAFPPKEGETEQKLAVW